MFRPETVTEGGQKIFQDIKHDLHSDTGAIELQGLDRVLLQVATHENQGT